MLNATVQHAGMWDAANRFAPSAHFRIPYEKDVCSICMWSWPAVYIIIWCVVRLGRARAHVPKMCTTHSTCKTSSYCSPNHTHNFSAICPAEMRKTAQLKCNCAPLMTVINRLANGSLSSYQISAESVKTFPRYVKGTHLHLRTCARADVHTCTHHHNLRKMHR